MTIKKRYILLSIVFMVVFFSCRTRKTIVDQDQEIQVVECDTTLSYAEDIAVILQKNCVQCHSGKFPANQIDLTTYAGASKVVDFRFTCAVSWSGGCAKMPPSGQLPKEQLEELTCWIENGRKP